MSLAILIWILIAYFLGMAIGGALMFFTLSREIEKRVKHYGK